MIQSEQTHPWVTYVRQLLDDINLGQYWESQKIENKDTFITLAKRALSVRHHEILCNKMRESSKSIAVLKN